jgi:hypothetical protein
MVSHNQLRDIRQQLVPLWQARVKKLPEWKKKPLGDTLTPDRNMCLFTAATLLQLLQPCDQGLVISGGDVWLPKYAIGGFYTPTFGWQGHYWLQSSDGLIIDITAEQFGHAPVIITSSDDPRYHANFTPREIKKHHSSVIDTRNRWLQELT